MKLMQSFLEGNYYEAQGYLFILQKILFLVVALEILELY